MRTRTSGGVGGAGVSPAPTRSIPKRGLEAGCILTTRRSDLSVGALDVVLDGEAELVTENGELEPIAQAFARRSAARRSRPGLGFRKGRPFGQTTWHFPR